MTTGPQDDRERVLRWVRAVTSSLEEQSRLDGVRYQQLSAEERWKLVAAACRGVVARLDDRQRARAEEQAEIDARAFGAVMRQIRERLGE